MEVTFPPGQHPGWATDASEPSEPRRLFNSHLNPAKENRAYQKKNQKN